MQQAVGFVSKLNVVSKSLSSYFINRNINNKRAFLLSFASSTSVHKMMSRDIAEATNLFSVNLLKQVLSSDPGNVVVSPLGLSTLLAILQQGSSSNTRAQLTQILHASPELTAAGYSNFIQSIKENNENPTIEFVNSVLVRQGRNILESFKSFLKQFGFGDIGSIDFRETEKVARVINLWAEKNTHGRIKNVISPESISPLTSLFLVNAIYFKSPWMLPFNPKFTKKRPFYKNNRNKIEVPTMYNDLKIKFDKLEDIGSGWVELPFDGERYSLVIVLPAKLTTFEAMTTGFTDEHLKTIINALKTFKEENLSHIELSLPKFQIGTDLDAIPILQKLGLTDIFDIEKSDLTGITGEPMTVEKVLQKAEIEIDEKGGVASAVTVAQVMEKSGGTPFVVDRPFLFFIIDKMNSITLFAGKVADPSL